MAENTTTRVVEVQVDNAEAIKLIADYNAKIEESTAKEKALREAIKKKGEATAAARNWRSCAPNRQPTSASCARLKRRCRTTSRQPAKKRGRTENCAPNCRISQNSTIR